MLVERVLYRFDSVQHYSQSLNDLLSVLRPKLLERRKKHFGEECRIFEKVLEQGVQEGVFDLRTPRETAMVLLEATNSLLPYNLSAAELGDRAEIGKKAERIADVMLRGLLRRENGRPA